MWIYTFPFRSYNFPVILSILVFKSHLPSKGAFQMLLIMFVKKTSHKKLVLKKNNKGITVVLKSKNNPVSLVTRNFYYIFPSS